MRLYWSSLFLPGRARASEETAVKGAESKASSACRVGHRFPRALLGSWDVLCKCLLSSALFAPKIVLHIPNAQLLQTLHPSQHSFAHVGTVEGESPSYNCFGSDRAGRMCLEQGLQILITRFI